MQSHQWATDLIDPLGFRLDQFPDLVPPGDIIGTLNQQAATEATCLGAGILAATALGWYTDAYQAANAMTRIRDKFVPNPDRHAFYNKLYSEVYRHLFPSLQPLLNRLTDLSENYSPGG